VLLGFTGDDCRESGMRNRLDYPMVRFGLGLWEAKQEPVSEALRYHFSDLGLVSLDVVDEG
jgi:hypothetical protein